LLLALALFAFPAILFAQEVVLPSGGSVIAPSGSTVTTATSGSLTTQTVSDGLNSFTTTFDYTQNNTLNIITQMQNLIINWMNGFSISSGSSVNVTSPNTNSNVLHRDLSGNISNINGAYTHNAATTIINGKGIIFGPNASINAASLIASTLDIRNEDFLNGVYKFVQNGSNAFIINKGNINIRNGGYAILLSQAVQNLGNIAIEAGLGKVVLASGEKTTLHLDDNGDISVVIDEAVKSQVLGITTDSAVKNTGTITNNGGKVILTAKVLNRVFDYAINNSGVITANNVVSRNGILELTAEGAPILNSGSLYAGRISISAPGTGFTNIGNIIANGTSGRPNGGLISVLAKDILHRGLIAANSLEGGDAGQIVLISTSSTVLDSGSRTEARALGLAGSGGRILINSLNGNTAVNKNAIIDISAGSISGNGGFSEVGAFDQLGFFGILSGRAPPGYLGSTFILDPTNLVLSTPSIPAGAIVYAWATKNIIIGGDISLESGSKLYLLADHKSSTPGDWDNGTGEVVNNDDYLISAAPGATDTYLYIRSGSGIGTKNHPILTNIHYLDCYNNSSSAVSSIYVKQQGVDSTLPLRLSAFTNKGDIEVEVVGTDLIAQNVIAQGNNKNVILAASSGGNIQVGFISAPAGLVSLSSANNITQDSTESTTAAIVATDLVVRADGTVSLMSPINKVANLAATFNGSRKMNFYYNDYDALNISRVDGVSGIFTNGGNVIVTSGQDLQVSLIDTTATTGPKGNVTLRSFRGAIVDGDSGSIPTDYDVIANKAILYAAKGIGPNDALDTQVSELQTVTSSGNINITNTGSLILTNNGSGYSAYTGNGNIDILATSSLTINSWVWGVGNVTLSAAGNASTPGNNLIINANITTSAPYPPSTISWPVITLNAGDNVYQNSGKIDFYGNGVLYINAGTEKDASDGQAGDFIQTATAEARTHATPQFISAFGNVVANKIWAGSGTITIAAGGYIRGLINDIVADIDGGIINLTAKNGGIGTPAAPLNTYAYFHVNADTSNDNSNIYINGVPNYGNGDKDFKLGLINAGSGNVYLKAPLGAIIDTNGTLDTIIASGIQLIADKGIGSTDSIETRASSIKAMTMSGNINIANTGNILVDLILSNGGNINIYATGDIRINLIDSSTIGLDITPENLGSVTVTAENGSILDNDLGSAPGDYDIIGKNLILSAAVDIGGAGTDEELDIMFVDGINVYDAQENTYISFGWSDSGGGSGDNVEIQPPGGGSETIIVDPGTGDEDTIVTPPGEGDEDGTGGSGDIVTPPGDDDQGGSDGGETTGGDDKGEGKEDGSGSSKKKDVVPPTPPPSDDEDNKKGITAPSVTAPATGEIIPSTVIDPVLVPSTNSNTDITSGSNNLQNTPNNTTQITDNFGNNLVINDGNSLPAGWSLVSGSATFDTSVNGQLTITSTSDNVIIDYASFNIGGGSAVYVIQSSANSVILHRVIGDARSSILGIFHATGRNFLINPNGISFGSSARVSAPLLLASTLNIRNEDFLSHNYAFYRQGGTAYIKNEGQINTSGGVTCLFSQSVDNFGVIEARLGKVFLASGERIAVGFKDLNDSSSIYVAVDQAVSDLVLGPDGDQLPSAISNSGSIFADGGSIVLNSKMLDGLFTYAINNTGIIRANTLVEHTGSVELIAEGIKPVGSTSSPTPVIYNSGTIEALAGTVSVIGEGVDFINAASGIIRVNGDVNAGDAPYLFNGGLVNISASNLLLDGRSSANAAEGGGPGQIIIHSDSATKINGGSTSQALAFGLSGNGGRITVTGKNTLVDKKAVIDVSAGSLAGNAGFITSGGFEQLGFFGILSGRAPPGNNTLASNLVIPADQGTPGIPTEKPRYESEKRSLSITPGSCIYNHNPVDSGFIAINKDSANVISNYGRVFIFSLSASLT